MTRDVVPFRLSIFRAVVTTTMFLCSAVVLPVENSRTGGVLRYGDGKVERGR